MSMSCSAPTPSCWARSPPLRAAGKDRPDQFLGGIDGEPEAVAEIKKGGGPYKTSISLASPVFGYAMGQHAADWLEGKSIPQAMDILPSALTIDNIAQYEADLADPAAVYADPARRAAYLKMYGNICYDTRDQYVNFPWSSEPKLPNNWNASWNFSAARGVTFTSQGGEYDKAADELRRDYPGLTAEFAGWFPYASAASAEGLQSASWH